MDVLSIVMLIFLVLELFNVLMLYLAPGARLGNGVGIFNAYEKSKKDLEVHELVKYLIYWVAGTKIIFIVLLIGILITGTITTKVFSTIALIFSILTFFSRLYPTIKKLDNAGGITPRGYSKTLAIMIMSFVGMFAVAIIVYFVRFYDGG